LELVWKGLKKLSNLWGATQQIKLKTTAPSHIRGADDLPVQKKGPDAQGKGIAERPGCPVLRPFRIDTWWIRHKQGQTGNSYLQGNDRKKVRSATSEDQKNRLFSRKSRVHGAPTRDAEIGPSRRGRQTIGQVLEQQGCRKKGTFCCTKCQPLRSEMVISGWGAFKGADALSVVGHKWGLHE